MRSRIWLVFVAISFAHVFYPTATSAEPLDAVSDRIFVGTKDQSGMLQALVGTIITLDGKQFPVGKPITAKDEQAGKVQFFEANVIPSISIPSQTQTVVLNPECGETVCTNLSSDVVSAVITVTGITNANIKIFFQSDTGEQGINIKPGNGVQSIPETGLLEDVTNLLFPNPMFRPFIVEVQSDCDSPCSITEPNSGYILASSLLFLLGLGFWRSLLLLGVAGVMPPSLRRYRAVGLE
jgi:hypothetical protein